MKRFGFALAIALALLAPPALGGGFLIYEHGAAATGMADARTAIADDVNCLYYNPAAITELPGLQLELGLTGILPYVSYEAAKQAPTRTYLSRDASNNSVELPVNDGQNDTNAKIRGFNPIHLYAAYNIEKAGTSVGFGLNNPFGLGTFWPKDWDGRFIATETMLQTFFMQPVVAVDIAKLAGFKDTFKLSFAAGFDFVYGTAHLAKEIDLRTAEAFDNSIKNPEGSLALDGTAVGYGYNFALFAELPGWVSFGASARSHVSMDFSGNANIAFNPAGELAKTRLGLLIPDKANGSVSIDLPWQMNFGVAFLGVKNLKIDFDVYAAFFSSYDRLQINFDCQTTTCPNLKTDPIIKNFGTSWQFSLGAEYMILDGFAVRAGYGLVTNPVPDSTYSPDLPDGRRDLLCVGLGYRGSWFKVDLGYMLAMWSGDKTYKVDPATGQLINNVGKADSGGPNGYAFGHYSTVTHLLAASWSMNFF